ncbi:hypothetical protein BDZ90DRAFT_163832 [Jaminaea rosea]|uniref:Transmembrane protein n=1 Tax=Jaminaea rosea TaxID=1569628 RepID=A0A316UUZ3_9BASI|nr:hypothetical protein BDZ90DRAFT_163832 [Jaminaea rosea]PWN28151.1 hypothetical protein BDZ90DRAFT_163832 [Jaminaea rosea]
MTRHHTSSSSGHFLANPLPCYSLAPSTSTSLLPPAINEAFTTLLLACGQYLFLFHSASLLRSLARMRTLPLFLSVSSFQSFALPFWSALVALLLFHLPCWRPFVEGLKCTLCHGLVRACASR